MNLLNKPYHWLLRYLSRIVNGGSDGQLLSRNVSLADELEWVTPSALSGITDADAIHDNVAGEIAAIVEKAVPVAADKFIAEDSAAGDAKVHVQMGSIDHDTLTNFVGNKHIDWTNASQNFLTTGNGEFNATLTVNLSSNIYGINVIKNTGAGISATASVGYRDFVIESNLDAGGSILTGGSEARVVFGAASTQANAAVVAYNAAANLMTVGTQYASGESRLVGGSGSVGVYVDSSGNVGIKNGAPSSALDVTGDLTISGDFIISGSTQYADAAGIEDDSGNEQLIFQKTTSAVNYFEIENAATGNGPIFRATGSDTDFDLNLETKGAGEIITSDVINITTTGTTSAEFALTTAVPQVWTFTNNGVTGRFTFADTTNGKIPFKIWPNTDDNLLRLGNTSSNQVDITGDLKVTGIIENPVYTDGTRPAASSVVQGGQIWNSSDNAPNWSDGANWRDAAGAVT